MAARQGALAAGAARASGERARRRSTPLIGADPVVPADAPDGPAEQKATASAKSKAKAKAKTGTGKPTTTARKARKATAKGPTAKQTAKAAKPAKKNAAKKSTKTSATAKPARPTTKGPTTVKPPTAPAPTTARERPASEPVPGVPTTERPPHRPAPQVRSAPSRTASRQSGERRNRGRAVPRPTVRRPATTPPVAPQPATPPVTTAEVTTPPVSTPPVSTPPVAPPRVAPTAARVRRPRVDPREKARRDAERPHLRIAEPPLDPTVLEAPSRSGLPVPDVGDALDALVGMLRLGAEAAGVAPEDVERRVAQVLAYVRRRVDGDYEVDDFGYDVDFTENVFYPMLRPIYRHWFRVEVRGIENIPATGGALVVSNHSGTIALDSLMVQLAIHDEHPQRRVMRALGADLVFSTPFLGTIARRSGSTLATTADAERLFEQGELVGVFPEGFKGVGKPFRERYKLQRFGRGGFVSAALQAQVPIIPCSVVGAEETFPILGNMGTVARLFGLPYAPITPTFPWLGPLGLVPLPSKWIIEFGTAIPTDGHGAGAADDPMLVFDLTDQVRETIQQTLYTLLMHRRSVFF
jgi:1-acyl-sn-glycerol-3-phosphate acyltransferase